MIVNMSRHCDFIASTVKFICAEANEENSNTMKVSASTKIKIYNFKNDLFQIKEFSNSNTNLNNEIDLIIKSSNILCEEVSNLSKTVFKVKKKYFFFFFFEKTENKK